MHTTMDAAGRLVIPKTLREALGLAPGHPLELRIADGRLVIEAAPTPMRLEGRDRDVYAVADAEVPTLTADEVRTTLDRLRR